MENNFVKKVELDKVVGVTSTLPVTQFPEVAFAGRSNVGKSSLINGLCGRKSYARVSGTPGKTQTVNYYLINDKYYFVDLPGYGYANVSKEKQASWGAMIEGYLNNSKNLRYVFLLVDIRRVPNDDDRLMYRYVLESGLHPAIICTKADKIGKTQIQKSINTIKTELKCDEDTRFFVWSALKKTGLNEIIDFIKECFE
ncbi:MAG: ribosome biogenesis GTP-binding protein YihA/YsxC [Lachnospiraceae bacterium]|jgi:GTP-binding protein|nr:ribosome biogenesis GTP-binding protein YihA/YsxC [Lachnospiraceae bacterium]HBR04608.1 YihA family ribosome biogenesis GTP-binding protein [Lachnospiraceae bacterium]